MNIDKRHFYGHLQIQFKEHTFKQNLPLHPRVGEAVNCELVVEELFSSRGTKKYKTYLILVRDVTRTLIGGGGGGVYYIHTYIHTHIHTNFI